jgi:hypothetical protein
MKEQNKTETKVSTKGREFYSSAVITAKRNQRRVDAELRQDEHNTLTTSEKIAKCKFRSKKGIGESKKEMIRLLIKLEKEKEAKKVVKVEAPKPTATPETPEKGSKYKRKQAKKA